MSIIFKLDDSGSPTYVIDDSEDYSPLETRDSYAEIYSKAYAANDQTTLDALAAAALSAGNDDGMDLRWVSFNIAVIYERLNQDGVLVEAPEYHDVLLPQYQER